MNTHIKSALNQIKAEDELIEKTDAFLRKNLSEDKNSNVISIEKRSGFSMKKKIAIAACLAVFICGASIGGYAYYKTPVSYLSLDINPSVELGVNSFSRVVSATGYNADGKTILEGKDVVNSSVENAVNTLVKSASDKGFIASDGSTIIAVTSETDKQDTAKELENDAEKGADEAVKSEDKEAVVYKDNVALARRDEAVKLGITPGKLNLIQKLQKLDPTITVDQYKDAKVKDIMKKTIELRKTAKAQEMKNSNAADNIEKAVGKSEENKAKNASKKASKKAEKAQKDETTSEAAETTAAENKAKTKKAENTKAAKAKSKTVPKKTAVTKTSTTAAQVSTTASSNAKGNSGNSHSNNGHGHNK